MKKWEYWKLPRETHESIKNMIDMAGEDGWELVQILPVGKRFDLFFKREIPEPPASAPKIGIGLSDAAELVEHHGIQNL